MKLKRFVQSRFLKSNIFSCDIKDTIVLAGAPRSGTTWLMEILSHAPGYKTLHEPIQPARYPAVDRAGFEWRTCISPEDTRPEASRLMKEILQGQWGTPERWRFQKETTLTRALEFGRKDKVLVKFVRANRMLRWMENSFPIKGSILLMRHPCAVVASMRRRTGWFSTESLKKRFGSDPIAWAKQGTLPDPVREQVVPVLQNLSSHVEVLAALWGLDHAIPLKIQGESSPFLLVFYEHLVTQPRETLSKVAEFLDIGITGSMIDQIGQPSSAVWGDKVFEREKQIKKWYKRLSEDEVDQILSVVDDLGVMGFYDDDIHPRIL